MRPSEWPLITFTLLGQLAAGMFLVALALRASYGRRDQATAARLTDRALFWTGPVMFLAIVASFLHLGAPLGAANALRHLGQSWLSREVALASAFFLAWAAGAWLESRPASRGGSDAWHWVTALIGLAMVFSMAKVYTNTIILAWATLFTPVSFFATTLLLGALGAGAFVAYAGKSGGGGNALLIGTGLLAAAAVAVQLLAVPFYLARLGIGEPAARLTLSLLTGPFAVALGLRLVLAVAAGGGLSLFIWWQAARKDTPVSPTLVYVALSTAAVAELLGRYLFYTTGRPLGPG